LAWSIKEKSLAVENFFSARPVKNLVTPEVHYEHIVGVTDVWTTKSSMKLVVELICRNVSTPELLRQ
jgi:hypothetical protein